MGTIIKDKRWSNTIWCFCKTEEEYYQFAKDFYLLKGIQSPYGHYDKEERWCDDGFIWSELFEVDIKTGEDEEKNEYWEEAVNPIDDEYEIKNKPELKEYPVIVHYDHYHKNILWISLKELNNHDELNEDLMINGQ